MVILSVYLIDEDHDRLDTASAGVLAWAHIHLWRPRPHALLFRVSRYEVLEITNIMKLKYAGALGEVARDEQPGRGLPTLKGPPEPAPGWADRLGYDGAGH